MANRTNEIKRLRVQNVTGVPGLSQAIEREIAQRGEVILLAVGAGAVNQAVKGIARASAWSGSQGGKEFLVTVRFEHGEPGKRDEGHQISRIALHVKGSAA